MHAYHIYQIVYHAGEYRCGLGVESFIILLDERALHAQYSVLVSEVVMLCIVQLNLSQGTTFKSRTTGISHVMLVVVEQVKPVLKTTSNKRILCHRGPIAMISSKSDHLR